MARALFFLGRGPDAAPIGSVYLETRAERTNAEPTPDVVATLPIGRDVLTATNPDDYEHGVGDLLIAWRAGGFGDAYTRDEEQLASDESPHVDGTFPGDTASPMPYAPTFRLAYAYDQGRVWLWRAGAWHTVTVTDPADAADGRPVVEVAPAARRYGENYADTAALDLPQLAVWIMAELTARGADGISGLPAHARYSAAVNPTRREIALWAFGLTDDEVREHPDTPASGVMTHYAQPIIDAHNWTNPGAPHDRRFTFTLWAFDQGGQRGLIERGRGPGTVTVIDTDPNLAGWWW